MTITRKRSLPVIGNMLSNFCQSTFFRHSFSRISIPKIWSSHITPPKEFIHLPCSVDEKVKEVKEYNLKKTKEMIAKYPHIMRKEFTGEVVYTLSQTPPEQMIKKGGLIKSSSLLWLSNTGAGNNLGSICFSLIPNVTALFVRGSQNFMYCFPLNGLFLIPSSQWREIISPGSFPLPSWWLCRPLIELTLEKVILGPMMGRIPKTQLILDEEQFNKFAGSQMNKIEAIDCGEDFPYDYVVGKEDSKSSAQFLREMKEYYEKQEPELRSFKSI